MRGSFVRGYNVSTFEGRGHGSSEAGQNRLTRGLAGQRRRRRSSRRALSMGLPLLGLMMKSGAGD